VRHSYKGEGPTVTLSYRLLYTQSQLSTLKNQYLEFNYTLTSLKVSGMTGANLTDYVKFYFNATIIGELLTCKIQPISFNKSFDKVDCTYETYNSMSDSKINSGQNGFYVTNQKLDYYTFNNTAYLNMTVIILRAL
jgi:hypothetical protein